MAASLLVSYVENLIPFIREYKNLAVANSHLFNEIVWPYFWVVQLWLMFCFLMYCTVREVGRVLGAEKVRSMFFGPG